MKEAMYYKIQDDNIIQCNLCPHRCILEDNKTGFCRVRKNKNGTLYSLNYGVVSAISMDPIEKKPLYHFYPGKKILSIGGFGCNMLCKFCQNWRISQTGVENNVDAENYAPDDIIKIAKDKKDNIGIAYTYNEPTIWYEFMLDIASKVHKEGMKNIMVTNGYINPKPLKNILKYMDAFNIDLKAFNEEFYNDITFSKLKPVKETIKTIKKAGKHIEITNLIIPTLNDNIFEFKDMINWIANEIGKDTVLHLSRYFPTYKLTIKPTSLKKMWKLYEIASKKLNYVYLGNMPERSDENNLYCNNCNELLIRRSGYSIQKVGINKDNRCKCGFKIPIINDRS